MLAGLSDSNEHADLDVINDAVAKQDSNSFVYNTPMRGLLLVPIKQQARRLGGRCPVKLNRTALRIAGPQATRSRMPWAPDAESCQSSIWDRLCKR
jgi:hypothetical protein